MNHSPHLADSLIIRSLIAKIEKLEKRLTKLENLPRNRPSRKPMRRRCPAQVTPAQSAVLVPILDRAARINGTTVAEICGSRGSKRACLARAEACYDLHEAGLSSPVIGRALGDRDHSTILHLISAHKLRISRINPEGPAQ